MANGFPPLTIFMPVRNGGRHFDMAVSSVRAQTDCNWRLVILDGMSTDGTSDRAREMSESDDRIDHILRSDRGQYDAVITGIADTPCELIGWLNADDLYTPWAVAAVRRFFDHRRDADWATGLPALWDHDGTMRAIFPAGRYSQRLIREGWYHDGLLGSIQQESVVFRRSLFDRLDQTERAEVSETLLAGDFRLWRAFARRAPLTTIPTVISGFRQHGGNRSTEREGAYLDEVYGAGGKRFPAFIARRLRSLNDLRASWAGVKAARVAAHDLDQEIRKSDDNE